MKHLLLLAMLSCASTLSTAQVIKSDFDHFVLPAESYWNGSDGSSVGGFSSGSAYFTNAYHSGPYPYWEGFAYSNTTDVTTAGNENDISAITGVDYSGHGNYAPAQSGAKIKLTGDAVNTVVTGFYLTNSTYATISMENGDAFAKKFGGATGNDPDYFKLIVTGYTNGSPVATTVEAYLADFRNSNNSYDYILKNWRWVDLRPLGAIDSLIFSMESSDTAPWGMNTPAYFVIDEFNAPLFSPVGGQPGSTAISKNDISFVNWASTCTVARGRQDISSMASPLASVGVDVNAVGPATGSTIVSLGDSGVAVLTFPHPITNGAGADFAVFENGFTSGQLLFAEFAFVEVSSDGENFYRFPAVSNTSLAVQNNSIFVDPRLVYNLAGSAQGNYGTPFDLEELTGIDGLDVNKITHVKIVDVVGSINSAYASYDKNGNAVNDPWKTDFASSGFDLDAVGVIHESAITGVISSTKKTSTISLYPNPTTDILHVSVDATAEGMLQLMDLKGNVLKTEVLSNGVDAVTLSVADLEQGMYVVLFNGDAQQFIKQ